MYVLLYQEFKHKNGRRYKVNSPRAQSHETMDDVKEQINQMKAANVVDPPEGQLPYSYDFEVYRLDRHDDPMFAIMVGTTEPHVPKDRL